MPSVYVNLINYARAVLYGLNYAIRTCLGTIFCVVTPTGGFIEEQPPKYIVPYYDPDKLKKLLTKQSYRQVTEYGDLLKNRK